MFAQEMYVKGLLPLWIDRMRVDNNKRNLCGELYIEFMDLCPEATRDDLRYFMH